MVGDKILLFGSNPAGWALFAVCVLAGLYLFLWIMKKLFDFVKRTRRQKSVASSAPKTVQNRAIGNSGAAGCSSVLGTRKYQQDRVLVRQLPDFSLAVLCDGMGGMENGERASEYCVHTFLDSCMQMYNAGTVCDLPSFMEELVKRMDETVASFVDVQDRPIASGTTLVAGVIHKRCLYWVSVGDSRIYLFRNGKLCRLTRDHNYALRLQWQVENGELSAEEALAETNREALISYLGANGLELVDTAKNGVDLQQRDLVLFCSDGLYKILSDEQIARIVEENIGLTAEQIAQELTLAATQRANGNQDNTSVAILKTDDISPGIQAQHSFTIAQTKESGHMNSTKQICMSCFLPMGEYDVCPHCGWIREMEPKESYHLYPGMILQERYLLGIVLGFGGFGITYKAWDTRLNKVVAIKEFYPAGLVNRIPGQKEVLMFSGEKSEQFRSGIDRFLAEARNMAKFSEHPYIVNIYDFFEENHTAYIVMEYLDGMSLREYLAQHDDRLSFDDAMAIAEPVMRALEEIHKKGILHRDISPDNIYLTADNRVKVIDFGAARLATGEQELTLSVIIKPGYAPPEQYRSKSRQGPWTDVYALGATMYRCITGILPEESVDRAVEDHLKRPGELGAELPEYAEKAMMKALALKEGLRFSKMEQFRLAMYNQKKVDYPEIEYRRRKRRRIVGAAASLVVLLAVIAATLGYQRYMSPTIDPDTITVWVPSREDGDAYLAMQEIASRFEAEQEGFQVTVVAIPEEEYSVHLQEAEQKGELPTVFRSDLLGDELDHSKAVLDHLQRSLDTGKCLFLSDYDTLYPDKKDIPTGFQVPVIYINNMLRRGLGIEEQDCYQNIGELLPDISGIENIQALVIAPQANAYLPQDGTEIPAAQTDALAVFGKQRTLFYFADSAQLHAVQQVLAGNYSVAYYLGQNGRLVGRFTDEYSVSAQGERNTQLAGMMFINYLFSDYAQNTLYTQHDTSLPLNKAEFEQYVTEINSDLALLSELADSVYLPEEGGDT